MGSEWNTYQLQDVCDFINGFAFKSSDYVAKNNDTVEVFRMGYIERGGGFKEDTTPVFVPRNYVRDLSKFYLQPKDITIAMTDMKDRVAILGNTAWVRDVDRFVLNQRVGCLRVIRKDIIDPRFLYFYSNWASYVDSLRSMANSGVQVNLSTAAIKESEITVPTLAVQKKIAHILGTIDDKIELNRQMNATLEATAQALFKSWFVDFDSVIDNALAAGNPIPEPLRKRAEVRAALGDRRKPLPEAIQKRFPSRFVFSEAMGWIPEGWKCGCFRDISKHVRDAVKAEYVADYGFYVGLEHVGRKQIFLAENGSGESIESNKSGFEKNDLLFGKLRPYFHKVCIAPQEGICSTDILVFRPRKPEYRSYMYLTAYTEAFVEYANMRSTGTRMPRANAKDMLDYIIAIPPNAVLNSFESMIAPFWEKGMRAVEGSGALAKLRDTLLPKLLSGQLRIPDAEKRVADAV